MLLTTLALTTLTSAHFVLNYPPNAGFDENILSHGPCGGFTPEVNSSTPEIQVDRFQIAIDSTHPVATWSFRGTTSTSAPWNWTEIVPLIDTTGAGAFCLEYLSAPSEWAGSEGVLQVVDNSSDGVLFQVR
jgi:hypothetical protein